MQPLPDDASGLLIASGKGDAMATQQLSTMIFDGALQRIAARLLAHERPGHTLQPAALVNEAWLLLIKQRNMDPRDRNRFFFLAHEMMLRVLVDHAKRRRALKRGGKAERVLLSDDLALTNGPSIDCLVLDEALRALEDRDQRAARIVKLHVLTGLSHGDVADIEGLSVSSIEKEWRWARSWLEHWLTKGDEP